MLRGGGRRDDGSADTTLLAVAAVIRLHSHLFRKRERKKRVRVRKGEKRGKKKTVTNGLCK